MNVWRILVIDDRAGTKDAPGERYGIYQALSHTKHDNRSFSINFAETADDARQKISSNDYDMVLLDVILGQWDDDKGTTFKDLLTRADRRFAVGLVSSLWDQTSIPLVRSVLDDNPGINVPLMFTFSDFESGAHAALGVQIISHVRRTRGTHRLDIGENEPLRILHLSDLHFGAEDADTFIEDVDILSNHVHSGFGGSPHLIAITGDIGNTGHPDDYIKAMTWLRAFSDTCAIELPSPRILLVPGNHDFSIPLAAAASMRTQGQDIAPLVAPPGQHDRRLCAYAMQPFLEFARQVTPLYGMHAMSPGGGWVSSAFVEYGVVFSGFNSSWSCKQDYWPIRSIETQEFIHQKRCLTPFQDKIAAGLLLHVSLSHHSQISYHEVHEPLDDKSREGFRKHLLESKCAPRLLLHGHQHMRCASLVPEMKCLVVCAPTPSKRDGARAPDAPRGVNLLTLHREGTAIRQVRVKSIVKDQRRWKTDWIEGTAQYEFNE